MKNGSPEYKRNSGMDTIDQERINKSPEVEIDFANPNVVSLAKFETMRVNVKKVNPTTKGKSPQ